MKNLRVDSFFVPLLQIYHSGGVNRADLERNPTGKHIMS